MYLYLTPSVVVAVSVVFTAKEVGVDEQTLPQVSERETLGIESYIQANVVQRNATWNAMAPNDPRKLALDWILHADKMELESLDEKLSQRYILALIAFSMDSLAWKFCGNHTSGSSTKESDDDTCTVIDEAGHEENSSFWLSNAFECSWHGVSCVDDEVIGLDLREYIIGLLMRSLYFLTT